jgi:hypothetical protein
VKHYNSYIKNLTSVKWNFPDGVIFNKLWKYSRYLSPLSVSDLVIRMRKTRREQRKGKRAKIFNRI